MERRQTVWTLFAVLAITVLAAGCPKKPPATATPAPAAAPAPAEPAQEVARPPAPDTTGDQRPDPLSADLETANAYAREQGLLGDVYFDFDKYDLKPEARDRLARNAEFMRSHPEFTFTIEGHCDERGTNEYNLALGDRRANAAKAYVVSLAIGGERLRTISYGEERLLCTESNESCWWRNRRGHFVITGRSGGA